MMWPVYSEIITFLQLYSFFYIYGEFNVHYAAHCVYINAHVLYLNTEFLLLFVIAY